MAERQRLTTNFLTLAEGVALQVKDVYVPLGLVERKKQRKHQNDLTQSRDKDDPKSGSELYQETEITRKFEHDEFLEEVLKQKNTPKSKGQRITIIGEPGAGKTTLLQQISDWLSREIEQSIVIWVSLADLQEQELEEYLFQIWLTAAVRKTGQAEATTQIKNDFAEQFKAGRIWLLLDGLDEMSGNPLTEIKRQIRIGGSVSLARIILTCRINLWDGGINALDDFDTYRTLDFSYPEQVEGFIEKWFVAIEAGKRGQRLCAALNELGKERIRDLVKNPLRLTLLCLNWQSREGKLPDTQAGLYKKFVDDFYKWKQDIFTTKLQRRKQLNVKLGELAKAAIEKEGSRFRLRQEFVSQFLGDADDENSLLKLALNLGWLNQIGIDTEKNSVYAFFHTSFQEYFAAQSIDDWHFFLNHIPENPSQGTYRIFESQWKQTILLWLGREEENLKQQKQQFIDALVNFKDGCGKFLRFTDIGFYESQAYFLAAAGIAEFRYYSRADEIVTQIVKWKINCPNFPTNEVRSALQQTDRTKAIAVLVELLQSKDVDEFTRRQAAISLGEIGTGNEKAIMALVQQLQSKDVDNDIHRYAAESLEKIDTGNKIAIAALVELLQSKNVDEFTRRQAAEILGEIGTSNEKVIAALVQLLQSTNVDKKTSWQAAKSLEKIGTGNENAIAALVQLLQSINVDKNTRRQAVRSLGEIGTGNENAITALVQLLQSKDVDNDIHRQAAESLEKIGTGNENAIAELAQQLQSQDVDDFDRWWTADSLEELEEIGIGNEIASATLAQLLQSQDVDDFKRWWIASSLGKIDPGNEIAIAALAQLLQSPDVDNDICVWAAKSLEKIGTGNEIAIRALVQLLQSQNVDEFTRRLAASSLGRVGTGNENAICALVQLLQSPDVDKDTRWRAAKSLGDIGTGNENAIATLVELLQSATLYDYTRRLAAKGFWEDEVHFGRRIIRNWRMQLKNVDELFPAELFTFNLAASSLKEIGVGHKKVISALEELLQLRDVYEENRLQAASSLWKIDPGNEKAIAALVQLLQSRDMFVSELAAESLCKIGTGNEKAIMALVQLLQSRNVYDDTRWQTAYSLGEILENNKHRFAVVKTLSAYWRLRDNCYVVLWDCAQNMPYSNFYQAWHQHNVATLAMRNVAKILFTRII